MGMSRISAIFDADASGLTAGTKRAQDALRGLGGEISSLDGMFERLQAFADGSFDDFAGQVIGAQSAMARMADGARQLEVAWKGGSLTIAEYRDGLAALRAAADDTLSSLSRAQAITLKFQTPDQTHLSRMAEYNALLRDGMISQETYNRAAAASLDQLNRETEDKAALTAATERQREAERERNAIMAAAASLIDRVATAEEKHQASLIEASRLLGAGAISYEQYQRAVAEADRKLEESGDGHQERIAAQRQLDAAMREGRTIMESMANAEERYAARLTKLQNLLSVGAIDQRTFNRAVDAARAEMTSAGAAADTYKAKQTGLNAVLGRMNTLVLLQASQLFIQLTSALSRGLSAIGGVANETRQAVDQIDLLAKRTGQSAEALASLEFVGRQAGVGIEQLATATAKMDRLFVAATNGSKPAEQAFRDIGLAVADLAGLSAEERFDAIAAAIAKLPTPAEQTAAAIAIFGRSGAALVPMFQEMGGNLAAAREQAERLGFILSGAQVAAIDEMNDALDRAGMGFEGIVRQATAYLAPAIEKVADMWTSFVETTGGANIGRGVVEMMLDGAEVVARAFDRMVTVFGPVWQYAAGVVERLGGVANIWNGVMILGNSMVMAQDAAGKLLLAAGAAVVGTLSKVLSSLLWAVEKMATLFGPSKIGEWVAEQQAALDSMGEQAYFDMIQLGQEAGEGFANAVDNVFDPEAHGFAFGDAAAGTWEGWVEDMRATLGTGGDIAAEKINDANAALGATIETKLAGAVDARSKEGFKEMLRLMYGGRENADERTANAAERTADGVEELNDNIGELGVEAVAI